MEKSTENIIHVCFSTIAGVSLRYAVKKKKIIEGKKVIAFGDDLSQGAIGNEIDIEERINWWKNIDREDEKIHSAESDYLKESYKKFYKKIFKIKDSDMIYLWYGQCSQEFCAMMYTLELLEDKFSNIYLINVSDMLQEGGNIYTYRSVGEIMPEKLKAFIKVKRKLELKEFNHLLNEWNSLKNETSLLRVYEEGKMKSVDVNYYDIDILKYAEKQFKKSARIVGNVLGYSENKISDEYIFWRVQELVKSGMLDFKGRLGVMREMEIKITPKGLEYLSTDSEAISFWQNKEAEMQMEIETINQAKKQGRMEEKISIAKRLMDVLDIEVIAEKTGLTLGQITNLQNPEEVIQ